jgi:hypothetical protein
MMSDVRTTLSIDDDLLERLKQEAGRQKRSLRAVANEALRLGLERLPDSGGAHRFQVKPFPLGLKPGFQGVSLNQLYDQIEGESVAPDTSR